MGGALLAQLIGSDTLEPTQLDPAIEPPDLWASLDGCVTSPPVHPQRALNGRTLRGMRVDHVAPHVSAATSRAGVRPVSFSDQAEPRI
jgi:hypothetical protein